MYRLKCFAFFQDYIAVFSTDSVLKKIHKIDNRAVLSFAQPTAGESVEG